MRKNHILKFSNSWNHWKFSRNFVYRAIERYKELWGVEDRARSGRPESVRERIRRNPLWKQKIMSRELNISAQSPRASSGTIYTWERNYAERDTILLLLLRKSDGQEQSVSFSGTPRTDTKTPSSQTRNFSPSRSSITTRTTRCMLKRPLRCILSVQECRNPSYVVVWWEVSHQGVTHLNFCKKGVKLVPNQEDVLHGVVKHVNMTLFNGQVWVFQQDPVPAQKPRRIRSGCGGKFRPLSAPWIGRRLVQTSTAGTVSCGLFWRTWLAKSFTTTWIAWRAPSSPEIPLETVRAAIAQWPECLKACVEAGGGHFEWHYYK